MTFPLALNATAVDAVQDDTSTNVWITLGRGQPVRLTNAAARRLAQLLLHAAFEAEISQPINFCLAPDCLDADRPHTIRIAE